MKASESLVLEHAAGACAAFAAWAPGQTTLLLCLTAKLSCLVRGLCGMLLHTLLHQDELGAHIQELSLWGRAWWVIRILWPSNVFCVVLIELAFKL